MRITRICKCVRQNEGTSVLEVALIAPLLIFMLVGVFDFGRAYYIAIEVSSAAEAGAGYGSQYPTDLSGMVAAAKLDAPDVEGLQSLAAYGCECSDGSSATVSCGTSPSCTYNVVNYVQVTTNATYTPLLPYPGIPSTIALTGSARMRAAQ